jgi:hypothetical protein
MKAKKTRKTRPQTTAAKPEAGPVTPPSPEEVRTALAVWVMAMRARVTELRMATWPVYKASGDGPLSDFLDIRHLGDLAQAIERADEAVTSLEVRGYFPLVDPVGVARGD